jgi:3-deoxy-manno-octulosonate cytidylyltransferase (CMP-KDO synthetase)
VPIGERLVTATEFRVVIPARYASTRFPGKPLALLAGQPMIRHVYERAAESGAVEVIVATDDERIEAVADAFGATVVRTRADHLSGTERVAEVAGIRGWSSDAIVVNVQGDAPLIPARSVRQVAALLAAHPGAAVATLCTPIASAADYANPNVVKVVMDQSGRALYFSRAPIPCAAHGSDSLPDAWRHLGIYGYRSGDLRRLSAAPPCYLESVEKLEQLRALWLGMEIRVGVAAEAYGPDVDTPADVAAVERHLAGAVREAKVR